MRCRTCTSGPAGVEFDDTVVSNCEETTVEVSKVRDAARDIKA